MYVACVCIKALYKNLSYWYILFFLYLLLLLMSI